MKVVSDEGTSESEGGVDKKIEKINEWFKFVLNCSRNKKCFRLNAPLYIPVQIQNSYFFGTL